MDTDTSREAILHKKLPCFHDFFRRTRRQKIRGGPQSKYVVLYITIHDGYEQYVGVAIEPIHCHTASRRAQSQEVYERDLSEVLSLS